MKIIEKGSIKKDSQKRHIFDERYILEKLNSNFIVKYLLI